MPTRWNSTYEMLKRAWELRTTINVFVPNDEKLKECQISSSEWKKIEYLIAILQPVKDASQFLSGSEYITPKTFPWMSFGPVQSTSQKGLLLFVAW